MDTAMRYDQSQRGFTLLELIVTLAVASIVLGVGVPALSTFTARMGANAAVGDISASLALGRIGAVSHGRVAVLCPSSDGTQCSGGSDWSSGWLVFVDSNGDGEPGTSEIARRIGALPAGLALRSSAGRGRLRFQPSGWASGTNVTLNLCSGETPRARVILNNAGRVRVERDRADCPHA
jgi:type IV fimbrial biogenesis protein FimT